MTFMEMFLQLKLGQLRSPSELVLDDNDKPFVKKKTMTKKERSFHGERIKGFGSECGLKEDCLPGTTPSKINSI